MKKRTGAPSSDAIRAAVNPAEPPPITAIVFVASTVLIHALHLKHSLSQVPKLSRHYRRKFARRITGSFDCFLRSCLKPIQPHAHKKCLYDSSCHLRSGWNSGGLERA